MDNVEALPPFPEGWYFITSRRFPAEEKTDPQDLDGRGNRPANDMRIVNATDRLREYRS
ncbi:MAG: hypothetical protein OXN26_16285 [Gammaproteobacteria bacterium]|nr:hypothetical protein [Gammaproteobacteria bacterium]